MHNELMVKFHSISISNTVYRFKFDTQGCRYEICCLAGVQSCQIKFHSQTALHPLALKAYEQPMQPIKQFAETHRLWCVARLRIADMPPALDLHIAPTLGLEFAIALYHDNIH